MMRVPITRRVHWIAEPCREPQPFVEDRDDAVAEWYGERATGTEIVLNVDDQQGVAALELAIWAHVVERLHIACARRAWNAACSPSRRGEPPPSFRRKSTWLK